jgi:hypothetical protein
MPNWSATSAAARWLAGSVLTVLGGGQQVNVQSYGAMGDGVHDDTAAFLAAIAATPAGGTLSIPTPSAFYLLSQTLTLSQPIALVGQEQSALKMVTPNTVLFQLSGAGPYDLEDLHLTGPQYLTQNGSEMAIAAQGASAASPLVGLTIEDCAIDSWGMYGIYLLYVQDFLLRQCKIKNINYTGIGCLSVSQGRIVNNRIDNVIYNVNAYGIYLSRITNDPGELTTNPNSSKVQVSHNVVSNVPYWHGINTHSGQGIRITDNIVTACATAISAGSSKNFAGLDTYAPRDVLIADNECDAAGNAQPSNGIFVVGAPGAVLGASTDYAEGCAILGNTVRGYGDDTSSLGAAVLCKSTRGLQIQGNTLVEPAHWGVLAYFDNFGVTIEGNTIQDVWSNLQGSTAAIEINSDYNTGLLGNNTIVRGSKTAAHVNDIGTRVENLPHNSFTYLPDHGEVSNTVLYDPGNRVGQFLSSGLGLALLGNGNATWTTSGGGGTISYYRSDAFAGTGAIETLQAQSVNSNNATVVQGQIFFVQLSNTAGSENGQIRFLTRVNGALVQTFTLDSKGTFAQKDAVSNSVPVILVLEHDSTGTPAAGFGGILRFIGNSDTVGGRTMADIQTTWSTAADGTRKATLSLIPYDTAGRSALQLGTDGTQPLVGLYGVTPVARQTGGALTAGASYGANEQSMLQTAWNALRNLGVLT